jgi:hypothetical protein
MKSNQETWEIDIPSSAANCSTPSPSTASSQSHCLTVEAMLIPNGFALTLNYRPDWQCRYSGCKQPRHAKPTGALLRFCNLHRLRQNEHQRAFIRRRRRELHRRLRRMRVMSTGNVFVQMQLDDVFDFGHDSESMEGGHCVTNWHSLLNDRIETYDPTSTLNEWALMPVDSIDDLLQYLPAPYS